MQRYRYSPLPLNHIRLLRLLPHKDKNAPIQGKILACPLPDDDGEGGCSLYEALSYVWGSPVKPCRIQLDDAELSVTENLHCALGRLRDRWVERILWIDAICINQDDVRERNHQVSFMAQVYATASRVLVWLGDCDGSEVGAQAGLEHLRAIAADPAPTSPPEMSAAVHALLSREWFERIWVSISTLASFSSH